uniref:PITH domain-containing protein n=1 Tax=Mesocestoides corti TaxID=53468 RepID=A0A5K3G187_MESCO
CDCHQGTAKSKARSAAKIREFISIPNHDFKLLVHFPQADCDALDELESGDAEVPSFTKPPVTQRNVRRIKLRQRADTQMIVINGRSLNSGEDLSRKCRTNNTNAVHTEQLQHTQPLKRHQQKQQQSLFPTISLYGQRLTIISALIACVVDCYLGATTSGTTGGQGSPISTSNRESLQD